MANPVNQDIRTNNDARVAAAAATAKDFASAAHQGIDRVAEAAHPVVDRLSETAHGAVSKITDAAATTAESVAAKTTQVKAFQDELLDECRAYVRDNPIKALGFAVAAGFVLTRMMRS